MSVFGAYEGVSLALIGHGNLLRVPDSDHHYLVNLRSNFAPSGRAPESHVQWLVRSRWKTSCQILATFSSSAFWGATNARARTVSGAGNAPRSTFPFAVRGILGSK